MRCQIDDIGTSDGKFYDVQYCEVGTSADLLTPKTVIVRLQERSTNEPLQSFQLNLSRQFLIQRGLDKDEAIAEYARGEIVIFFEGDKTEWTTNHLYPNTFFFNR